MRKRDTSTSERLPMLHAIMHADPDPEAGPRNALRPINRQLCDKRIEESFVTAFLTGNFTRSHRLIYSRAGHNRPLLMPRQGGDWDIRRVDAVGNLPLGILPDVEYQTAETHLKPGQMFLMDTDGIAEAMSPSRELFDESRLKDIFGQTDGESGVIIKAVEAAVAKHQAGAKPSEDQTMLVMKVNED